MSKNPKSTDNLFADALKAKDTEAAEEKAAAPVAETTSEPEGENTKDEAQAAAEPQAPAAPAEPEVPAEPEMPEEPAAPQISEIDVLKNRARMMNIQFSNNIGVDALKQKIQNKIDGVEEKPAASEAAPVAAVPAAERPLTEAELKMKKRKEIWDENMRLIRVRITNLDPKKKDIPGEIFTVANRYLGTVRKYIPYGEATDNGYHIPYVLYKALQRRQFLQIKTRKGRGGTPIVEQQYVREFALEVLPQLTPAELADLKAQQQSRGRDD